jgi:hypothetical protein
VLVCCWSSHEGAYWVKHGTSSCAGHKVHLSVYLANVEAAHRCRAVKGNYIAARILELRIHRHISGKHFVAYLAETPLTRRSWLSVLGDHWYG